MIEHDCTDLLCECKEFSPGYLVFSCGQVFSVRKKPKRLKGHVRESGYARVKIQVGQEKVLRFIHVIVCEAFCGPRSEGMECCHRDGNPSNNRAENLYWGSRLENARDMVAHERIQWGELSWTAKLTEQKVREIRAADTSTRGSKKMLAEKYGVTAETIRSVINYETWNPDNTKRKFNLI